MDLGVVVAGDDRRSPPLAKTAMHVCSLCRVAAVDQTSGVMGAMGARRQNTLLAGVSFFVRDRNVALD